MDEEVRRVRLPRNNEMIGIVESLLGAGRVRVICKDGKTRICRIPGKLRRKIWIHSGDAIILKPWDIQGDERGDVLWVYRRNEKYWLEKKGYLNF